VNTLRVPDPELSLDTAIKQTVGVSEDLNSTHALFFQAKVMSC
jgi:hypothetical protein